MRERGFKGEVQTINKEICDTNRAFYYAPIRKGGDK